MSTSSVYKLGKEALDERSPVLPLPPGVEIGKPLKIDVTTYGPLKALAEQAAEEAMPGRTLRIRAGLIVGPGDPSDRFLYWPLRLARGGEVLVPGSPSDPMQLIDVRDLADWMVSAIENQHRGLYNAVGPHEPTIGAVLARMQSGIGSSARLTWVPSTWLEANQAGDWDSFPMTVAADSSTSGFARVSAARALAQGLRFRSPGVTAKDTLAWWHTQPTERQTQPRPALAKHARRSSWRAGARATLGSEGAAGNDSDPSYPETLPAELARSLPLCQRIVYPRTGHGVFQG